MNSGGFIKKKIPGLEQFFKQNCSKPETLVTISSRKGRYKKQGLQCYTILVILEGEVVHNTKHNIAVIDSYTSMIESMISLSEQYDHIPLALGIE